MNRAQFHAGFRMKGGQIFAASFGGGTGAVDLQTFEGVFTVQFAGLDHQRVIEEPRISQRQLFQGRGIPFFIANDILPARQAHGNGMLRGRDGLAQIFGAAERMGA